ncbi:pleckstrin homology-like domain family B member 1 [Stomoxys calcitrans]|uniref:pleckstrin homology-like domain family B member 1 n=1 Tax=Stomoxys calcitrans TaxID=35570 RepID=UPI0027E34F3E|nr:pleckstrin homology-like domain family B member 1 [Stomoxys calcitrans]XP_013103115.2 pleckstrin homology-like domain family B member 1 [Stomoxys calcitrans]XP_013103116.2 pleckstrin homology-like domain family B member 1 [Stomoxys calcitrans]
MSLSKKDPSFCVAANDPHLVSLGGGRLSTAVTIHNIPIGDTTVGSSLRCNISLNGSGVRPLHCTIYRSEENEVTLVPERDARILIDGTKIMEDTNLTQGAMITIGKSYYLRFNNPAEAKQIRTAMGSSERISMPQIDFSQGGGGGGSGGSMQRNSGKSSDSISGGEIESFYETTIQPAAARQTNNSSKSYCKLAPIDINGLQCPKVFTADLVTVNLPAEDVLGQKYNRFAKNMMAESQRNEKNINHAQSNLRQIKTNNNNIYDNVPMPLQTEKKNNADSQRQALNAYDRYPKLGNLQIFPMNSINNEMNTNSSPVHNNNNNSTPLSIRNLLDERKDLEYHHNISNDEQHHLDDMLKICTEYTDRQNQNNPNVVATAGGGGGAGNSMTSSPIVQNRIITNGSLPRERKSPFQHESQRSFDGSFSNVSSSADNNDVSHSSSGYENVRVLGPKRVEINGQQQHHGSEHGGESYENVVVGKYVPQSPRTKIRTTCMSPKKEQSFSGIFSQKAEPQAQSKFIPNRQTEYDELLRTFGEKLQIEMQAIEESSRYQPKAREKGNSPASQSPVASRTNKNVHNLKLNLRLPSSLQNSPKLNKKPAPAPRTLIKSSANGTSGSLPHLSASSNGSGFGSSSNKGDPPLFRAKLEFELQSLQDKIHRLEAQRNATRVMEETQQAKLKQSIEMKSDQVKKLKEMLKDKKDNECLKEEIRKITESLDNDRKIFEDLEFQYLEEESEWHAYHEELKSEAKQMSHKLGAQPKEWQTLSKDFKERHSDAKKQMANASKLSIGSDHQQGVDKPYDISEAIGIMSQSLFGSAEMLCPRRHTEDVMSRSVNENMFFNNKIELPSSTNGVSGTITTSTPKRPPLQIFNIDDECLQDSANNAETFNNAVHFNLTLGNDNFEFNPLEKRVPSQDDIDRISKVTSDAPISNNTEGATTKIFDSIKEIERNRQLLLAQQGHHVIEHERQKMNDLKKKSHSEARAQYLSKLNRNSGGGGSDCVTNNEETQTDLPLHQQKQQQQQQHPMLDKENRPATAVERSNNNSSKVKTTNNNSTTNESVGDSSNQQRHSQPEFETNHLNGQHLEQNKRHSSSSRPLSEANSELSCELLTNQSPNCKSNIELSTLSNGQITTNTTESKQRPESLNSLKANSCQQQLREHHEVGETRERKRQLPKHQRPLTRYLPIFSPDLDLRQHIESAGHQIALCPHVFVDAHSCRGYLHKLGATFHGWSKRWFVLDRQRSAFIYYSDKLERKPRGGAYFSTIEEVYLDHLNISKSGRPHCTLIVKTQKRMYQLLAASDAAARIWIDAIITGAQGNLDY